MSFSKLSYTSLLIVILVSFIISPGCGENKNAKSSSAGGGGGSTTSSESSADSTDVPDGGDTGNTDSVTDASDDSATDIEDNEGKDEDDQAETSQQGPFFPEANLTPGETPAPTGTYDAPRIFNLLVNPLEIFNEGSITFSLDFEDFEMDVIGVIISFPGGESGFYFIDLNTQAFGLFSGRLSFSEKVSIVTPGEYEILVTAIDNEGNISDPLTVTLTVE